MLDPPTLPVAPPVPPHAPNEEDQLDYSSSDYLLLALATAKRIRTPTLSTLKRILCSLYQCILYFSRDPNTKISPSSTRTILT
jgi:hypothetical protein